jgi:AcrR family transcriptional regulator
MPENTRTTRNRIQQAALDLFLQQGVRKTSIDDIAARAGVTRVTVYRHFADREQLVGAAFRQVNGVFDRIREALAEEDDLDGYLARMATEMTAVPLGFMSGMAELEIVHAEIHADLRKARRQLLRAIFDQLYARAEQEGRLRPGLDKDVVEALFWEVVMTLPESSKLSTLGLTPSEMYNTLSNLLLYGLLER